MEMRKVIQEEISGRVRANRYFLKEAVSSAQAGEVLHAQGGWYAVWHLPGGIKEEEFVLELLTRELVYVHPGYFFLSLIHI